MSEPATTEPKKLTNAEKFPAIWKQFLELKAQRDALEKELAPARAEYDQERALAAPHEAKARAIYNERIKSHMPTMALLDQQLSALARAMGGKSTNDATPKE